MKAYLLVHKREGKPPTYVETLGNGWTYNKEHAKRFSRIVDAHDSEAWRRASIGTRTRCAIEPETVKK